MGLGLGLGCVGVRVGVRVRVRVRVGVGLGLGLIRCPRCLFRNLGLSNCKFDALLLFNNEGTMLN